MIAYLEAEMTAVDIIPVVCFAFFLHCPLFYGSAFAYSGPDCLLLTRCFLGFGKCWTFPWGTVCVYSCGRFLKCWYPTTITIGSSYKTWAFWGVLGVPPFKETPMSQMYITELWYALASRAAATLIESFYREDMLRPRIGFGCSLWGQPLGIFVLNCCPMFSL